MPCYGVPAPSYGNRKITFSDKAHCSNDISYPLAFRDQGWTPIDVAVPNPTCVVIGLLVRQDQTTKEVRLQSTYF